MGTRKTDIISEYQSKFNAYEQFTQELKRTIDELLEKNEIDCLIDSRTKTVSSFSDKLTRKGQNYKALSEIHDLSGVRIVVDRRDEVKKVQEIINKEFKVVEQQSEEDRISDADTSKGCFGYQSCHIIIREDEKQAEIQVRTLLQHSWAQFSHKYYYKNEDKVELEWRRNLFMLSAVLQLADKGFSELVEKYPQIKPEVIREFLNSEDSTAVLQHLETHAKSAGFKISPPGDEPKNLSALMSACQKTGIKTADNLRKNLQRALKYDDKYLAEIHSKIGVDWTTELAFLVELMLYKIHPKQFSVEDLIEQGWSKSLAEKLHGIAKKYHGKGNFNEHN